MTNTPTLPEAIKVLQDALNEDKKEGSYYYSWQANIAMAVKDEAEEYIDQAGTVLMNRAAFHELANEAAKNFLNMFIGQGQP